MSGLAKLTFLSLNLGSKKSVHEFVEAFRKKFDRLNVLVLNASIVTEARETTYCAALAPRVLTHPQRRWAREHPAVERP